VATLAETAATTAEIDRFVLLFDGLFDMTTNWLRSAPTDSLDWAPSDDAIHRFGDGKTAVTLRNLYIHVTISEHVWIGATASMPDGNEMPLPADPALLARLRDGDLEAEATQIHRANMGKVRAMDSTALEKTVFCSQRRWTGIEFLWAVYAHRAFHLGHVDQYLRFKDTPTSEFFSFHRNLSE
jgi:hypothetical protein